MKPIFDFFELKAKHKHLRSGHLELYAYLLKKKHDLDNIEWFIFARDLAMQELYIGSINTLRTLLTDLEKIKLIKIKVEARTYISVLASQDLDPTIEYNPVSLPVETVTSDEPIYNRPEPKKSVRARFSKPTIEEISEWLTEEKKLQPPYSDKLASDFYNYYEANGWTTGKYGKPMASWKGALGSTWRATIDEYLQKQSEFFNRVKPQAPLR